MSYRSLSAQAGPPLTDPTGRLLPWPGPYASRIRSLRDRPSNVNPFGVTAILFVPNPEAGLMDATSNAGLTPAAGGVWARMGPAHEKASAKAMNWAAPAHAASRRRSRMEPATLLCSVLSQYVRDVLKVAL